MQRKLRQAQQDLQFVTVRFDSLLRIDGGLRRSSGLLASAGAAVRPYCCLRLGQDQPWCPGHPQCCWQRQCQVQPLS